jgi:hypothetical protein
MGFMTPLRREMDLLMRRVAVALCLHIVKTDSQRVTQWMSTVTVSAGLLGSFPPSTSAGRLRR